MTETTPDPVAGDLAGDADATVAADLIEDTDTVDSDAEIVGEIEPEEVRVRVEVPVATPIEAAIEALLLMATEPLSAVELAQSLEVPVDEIETAVAGLTDFYTRTGRGFELRPVAGGWRYYTRADQADAIAHSLVAGTSSRLSQAALETLAVIAYLQPISRSRISAVRGVNADGVVRTLIARGLVLESGHDEITGAGLVTTTNQFLEKMGLGSLADLPPLAPYLPDATELDAELIRLAQENDIVVTVDEEGSPLGREAAVSAPEAETRESDDAPGASDDEASSESLSPPGSDIEAIDETMTEIDEREENGDDTN
ncbi:MAG: SMC-Scp complex subunit ScpB [Propionibacteriaceae bacterium]|jgi:segregation and condensation protein B|nr:SMC-Scp complex subunit ScpB [Propionibacteriaceae bacterium]